MSCLQYVFTARGVILVGVTLCRHDLETYPTAPLSQPVVGALCCARYGNDQKWYRARIESVVNVAKVCS